jgi:hypothetical protein
LWLVRRRSTSSDVHHCHLGRAYSSLPSLFFLPIWIICLVTVDPMRVRSSPTRRCAMNRRTWQTMAIEQRHRGLHRRCAPLHSTERLVAKPCHQTAAPFSSGASASKDNPHHGSALCFCSRPCPQTRGAGSVLLSSSPPCAVLVKRVAVSARSTPHRSAKSGGEWQLNGQRSSRVPSITSGTTTGYGLGRLNILA